jgi:transposase-like protein
MDDPKLQKQFPNCPSCGSDNVVRSFRRRQEAVSLRDSMFQVPYHCKACHQRFNGFRPPRGAEIRPGQAFIARVTFRA